MPPKGSKMAKVAAVTAADDGSIAPTSKEIKLLFAFALVTTQDERLKCDWDKMSTHVGIKNGRHIRDAFLVMGRRLGWGAYAEASSGTPAKKVGSASKRKTEEGDEVEGAAPKKKTAVRAKKAKTVKVEEEIEEEIEEEAKEETDEEAGEVTGEALAVESDEDVA